MNNHFKITETSFQVESEKPFQLISSYQKWVKVKRFSWPVELLNVKIFQTFFLEMYVQWAILGSFFPVFLSVQDVVPIERTISSLENSIVSSFILNKALSSFGTKYAEKRMKFRKIKSPSTLFRVIVRQFTKFWVIVVIVWIFWVIVGHRGSYTV